jgi:hypothetical protein
MAARINSEYKWFFDNNQDFLFEYFLLNAARETGDYSLYDAYLRLAFNNENDYFFQWASTNGDYQNMYKGIPLINSYEETARLNEERFKKGFEGYKTYSYNYLKSNATEETLWNNYISDSTIQAKFGGSPLQVETISLLGCMLMATKYGIEALTDQQINTFWLNDYVRKNNLYSGNSNLSKDLMAQIMTNLTNGAYDVSLALSQNDLMSYETLYNLSQSEDMYLVHLRIKTGGSWDHSVMLSGIDFTYDDNKTVTGISAIHVANPVNDPNRLTGKSTYTLDEIARWDIFRVIPAVSLDYPKK